MTLPEYLRLLDLPNVEAFLLVIRAGEGTKDHDGYRRLFGGDLFDSFNDHPRVKVTKSLGGKPITSTAAGAYQFLSRTWDECQKALDLPDFSPNSQDAAALFLINRRKALQDVIAGRVESAIAKCNREWASLPGSPYGQPTKTMAQCLDIYIKAGGKFDPEEKEQDMAPFIAAAIPALIQAAPALIRVFGDGERSEKNAQAAQMVANIAKEVTGETTVEGAVSVLQTDPAKAAEFREGVHVNMNSLLDSAERMQAMDEKSVATARAYNEGEPLMVDLPWLRLKFIHVLSLIFVGFSGFFAMRYWPDLTPELKGAIITLMVIAGWNGVRDYWMGSSNGSERKTEMLRKP